MDNLSKNSLFVKDEIPTDLLDCFESAKCGKCFVCNCVTWAREVWRVLRDDGTFWLNLGDSYASSAGGYNENGSRGTTAKISAKTQAATISHRERKPPDGLKPKDMCLIPHRVAIALQADGWWLRSAMPWIKRNPMPESCTDRPTSALEYMFLLTKSSKYYFDMTAIRKKKVDTDAINPYIDNYENVHRKTKGGQTEGFQEIQCERKGDSEKEGTQAVGSGTDFIQQMATIGKGEGLHGQVQEDDKKKSGSDEIHQNEEILCNSEEISNVSEGERINIERRTQKTGKSGELHKHTDGDGVGADKKPTEEFMCDLQGKEKIDKGSHPANQQGRASREGKHPSPLSSMQYTEGEQSINSGRNFRNTDLYFQSLEEPHGAIFAGEEMVGLDVNPYSYKEAHFATFPPKLVEPCIKSGSSEKGACPECGAPWER
ncbi:hypothetical protein LCGC14_2355550, partial [marine sediment metagenome]